MTNLSMTKKQRVVVQALIHGNINTDSGVRESDLDLDQLLEAIPKIDPEYQPTKASLQFSLRYLIRKGLIEKAGFESRRGKSRRILVATPLGIQLCLPRTVPGAAEDHAEMDGVIMEGFEDESLIGI